MIKLLVMDVDGTLTDGKIYIGENGEIMKAFSAHDAVGVRKLKKFNIVPIIITGRESKILINRVLEMEMNPDFVFQNVCNKQLKLEELVQQLQLDYQEIAYIGDDENDLECLKMCGLRGCPKNAMDVIKRECNFIASHNAGDGAVRDFIEYIIEHREINN